MKRFVNGQEVLILCLNTECPFWDDSHDFLCGMYFTSSEVVDCHKSTFKTGIIKPTEH